LREEEQLLVDGGHQRRSFVSVDEFSAAIVRIVARPQACRGEIINVGNPANDVSIRELGHALAREYAAQVPEAASARFRSVSAEAFYGPGYDDSARRIPDIGKAQRLLGWQPRETLLQMLPGIVRDYVARYGAELMPQPLALAARARTG
jgi:nucleoside-diphosphate-sugar epimerase